MTTPTQTSLRETIASAVTGEAPSSPDMDSETEKVHKWTCELEAADKFFEKFHKQADKAVDAFLDDKSRDVDALLPSYRLNLFHANVVTLQAMLYEKLPKAEADRRFFDPADDVARVAGEIITRILHNDMNDPEDKLAEVLRSALEDRLVAGLGEARVRYDMEEDAGDPENGIPPQKTDEWCDIVYTHWKDVRWSPCRNLAEMRWKAFRAFMTREECAKRFPEHAPHLTYNSVEKKATDRVGNEITVQDNEIEIWEIWDKASQCTYWYTKGYDKFLDKKERVMELNGFFPSPRPMIANCTTRKFIPKPDYEIARTLYEEIDELESRIAMLTAACKVVGVYDKTSKNVERMLNEGVENQLIPVDNWAMFAEKGGMKGVVDWMPIEQIVNAIQILSQQQVSRINQLYQVTGMSDILRGAASQTRVSATEQRIKAQFGGARIQHLQSEFAEFAADLLNKKVQLIQRFYAPERIIKLSNIMATPDAPLAEQAVALIKNPDQFNIRVSVRPESMAQTDYEQIRTERGELIQGVAQFLGMATPMIQQMPQSAPFLLQLLNFAVSGFRGASQMEGVIDQAVAAVEKALSEQASQPPPPSPEQIKAEQEQQKLQAELQARQAEQRLELQKMQTEMQMEREKFQLEMRQAQQEHVLKMQELQAKLEAVLLQTQAKVAATQVQTKAAIAKAEAQERQAEQREEQRDQDPA